MATLSSTSAALGAISSARRIDAMAYTLHGPVLWALEDAARRGTHVAVELEGAPFNDARGALARENARLANELRAAGADVRLTHVHAKALAVDDALYLDDRNWGVDDIVLRDTNDRDVQAARDVFDGNGAPDPTSKNFALHKRDALTIEARLLASARPDDDVIVETESFGYSNPVYTALEQLARRGLHPRLLVSERDLRHNTRMRSALDRLASDGVRVRTCADSEKLAVVANRAWIGSANASPAFEHPDPTDWGLRTADEKIATAARTRFERNWSKAHCVSNPVIRCCGAARPET